MHAHATRRDGMGMYVSLSVPGRIDSQTMAARAGWLARDKSVSSSYLGTGVCVCALCRGLRFLLAAGAVMSCLLVRCESVCVCVCGSAPSELAVSVCQGPL